MAIKSREEAEAILHNGGAPVEAKKEAQEYIDSLVIKTPDTTGLDDDEREALALQQNQLAAQETETPSGKTIVDPRTDEEIESTMLNNSKTGSVLTGMEAGKRASIEDSLINNPSEVEANIANGNWTQEEVDAVKSTITPEKEEELKQRNREGTEKAEEFIEENKSAGETGSASKDAEEIVGDKNNRHYRAVKSIWSAYYDGDFGPPGSKEAKEVAWYYTIDSLAKLGNKIGKSLRNVGAAYVGGAIDNSEDEKSAWQEHQDSLRKEASDITKEGMGGSAGRQAMSENLRNEAMSLANDRNTTVKDLIDFYAKKMGKADSPITEQTYANIIANLAGAGSNMSLADKVVTMGGDGLVDKVYNAVANFFGF